MAPISSPHTISTVARRLMFGVALLFGYTALPASAQVTHTVSGPANVSYCDATTITTRFVNTGATLDNLSITQLLPHADFVFVPGSGVITMPGGMVVTNDPSISGQQLVWDFSNVASTSSLSHVVITEAFYTPTNTPKESHEWIELYNPLSASVDMTGWSIRDAMPGQTDLLPPIVINPGEFVIIAASTNAFMAANPGYTGRVFEVTDHTLGSGLNTFADGVFLVNASSVTVDAMSFGGSTAAFNPAAAIAGTGQSNQRSPANQDTNTRNDWTVGSPTPGTGAFQSGINNGGEIVIAYRIEVACGAAAGQIRSFATYQQPAGGTLRTNLSSIFITANPGDLTVTKTPVVQNAGVGDTVVWTVTVKNEGFGNAPNVVIQDNIGSGFQFTSFSVNPTSAPPYGSAVQWDATVIPALTNLAPQQEVTLVVTALMVQCSDLVNTADARWGCRGLEAVPDSICEDTAVNGETAGASIIKIDRYPFLTAALVPPPTIGLDYCDGTEVTLYVTNSATGPDAGAAIDVQYYVFNPSGYQLTGPAVSNGFVQIGTLAPGATTSVTFRIVPGGDCPLDRDEQNIAMYAIYQDPCGNPFMGGPAFTTTRLTDLPWARVTKVMPPSVNPSSTGFPVTVLLEYSNLTAAAVNVYDIYPKHTNLAVANISAGGSLNVGEGRVEWNPTLTGDGVFTGRFDMVFLNPCNGPYGLLENVVIATNLVDCHSCPVDVIGSGRSYFTDAARVYCDGPGTGGCSFASTKFGTPGLVEICEPVTLTQRFASFSGSSTPTNWNGVQFTSSLANAQGYLASTSSVSVSIDGNDVTPFVTIAQSSPTLVLNLSGLNASAYSGPHLIATNLSISWDVSTTNTGSFVDRSALFMQPCGVEEDYYQWEVGRSELIISLAKTDFAEACGTVEGRIDLTQLASPELATTNRIFPSYDVDVVLDLDLLNAGGDGYSYVAGSAVFADFFDLAGNPIASFEPTISGHTLTWSLGDLRTNGVGSITYRLLVPCDLDPNVKQQARVLFNGRCDDDTVPQLRSSLSSTNDAPFVFQANLSYQIKPETLYLQDNLLVYTLEFLNSGNGTAFNVEPEFFFPTGVTFLGASIAPLSVSATNVVWELHSLGAPVDSLIDRDGDGFFDDLPPGGTFTIIVTGQVVSCLNDTVGMRAHHGCNGDSCQVPLDKTSTFVPLAGSLVTRTVFPAAAELCATNTVRYDVRNSGLMVDRVVQVEQLLPTGMIYIAGSTRFVFNGVTNAAPDPTGSSILLFKDSEIPPFLSLAPGDELSILYDVYVSCDAAGVDNMFVARGWFTDICGNLITNQESQSVMPLREPVLELTKEGRRTSGSQTNFTSQTIVADPGDAIEYRLRIRHDALSDAPAHAMELADLLPPGVRYDGASVTPDSVANVGPNIQLVWSNTTLLSLVGGAPWSEASTNVLEILVQATVTNCVLSTPNEVNLLYGCDPSCLSLAESATHTVSSEANVQISGSSELQLTPCGGTRSLVITNLGGTVVGMVISNVAPPGYLFESASVTGEFNAASLTLTLTGTPVGSVALINFSTAAASGATDVDDDAGDGLGQLDIGYRDALRITFNLISDGTGLDCLADPTDLDFEDPDPATIPNKSTSSTIGFDNMCAAGETVSQTANALPDQPDPDIDLQPNSVIVTNGQIVTFTATVKNNAEVGNAENLHVRLQFGSGWTNLTFVSSNIVSSGSTSMTYEQQGDTNVLVSLPGVILDPIDDHVTLTFNATAVKGKGPLTARAEVVGACTQAGISPDCVFTNTLGEPPMANTMTGSVINAVNQPYYGFDQDQSLGLGYDLLKTVRLAGEPAPGGATRDARIGEDLIYRIRATYFGQTFSNVVVTESLPTNLVFGTPVDAGSSPSILGWTWDAGAGTFTLPSPITNDVDFVVDIPVIVRNILANQGETNNQTTVINVADSTFTVAGATNVPMPSSTTVPLYEPNLSVLKTANLGTNTVQAGDTILFSNVVRHTSLSQTTAYDVVFTDTLPLGLTFTGINLLTDGIDNDGDGLTDEADEATLVSGNTITITTNNNSALSALTTNQTLTFVFPVRVDNQFIGTTITNIGDITWTSLPGVGTNGEERTGIDGPGGLNDYNATDPEPIRFRSIQGVSKDVVSTTQTNTLDPHITIGERVTYRLRVDVPQGVVSNLVITDIVPPGMDFVGTNPDLGLTYPGYGYSFAFQPGGPFFDTNTVIVTDPDPTPASSLTADGSGQNITFTIGSFTNLPDGNLTNDYFELYMEYVLLNTATNRGITPNAYSNANRATVSDAFSSVTVTSPIYVVAEHLPSVLKTRTPAGAVDAGDLITFTIYASNSVTALANAYDLVLNDLLTITLFDTGTITILDTAPGWSSTIIPLSGAALVQFTSDPNVALPPGTRVTNRFSVVAAQSLQPNQRFTNAAELVASDTIYGTPPTGIPDRDRGATNRIALAVTNMSFAKSLFSTSETNVVDSTNANVQVGEIVTYRLDVTLPETTITNLLVNDNIPLGMGYIIGSARVDDAAFGGTVGALNVLGPTGVHGAAAPNGSNLVIRFDGHTVVTGDNNPANNSFAIYFDSIVLNTNGVVGLPGNQSQLTNTATLTYTGNPSNTVPSGPVVTPVVEPRVSIAKSMSPPIVDAGDLVAITLVITNNGLATAYDVNVRDPLNPLIFDAATVTNVVAPAGYLFAVETNDVVIRTDTNAVQPDGTLPVGQSRTISFNVIASSNIAPNLWFTNVASVGWDSISGTKTTDEQRVYTPTNATAAIRTPNFSAVKTLYSTSETNNVADSTNANVQVGEIVTYRIEITVPEGTVTNLFILDELPNGMAYVLGSARTDTAGFAGTLGTLSVVPSGVGLGTSGQDVEITLLGNTTVNGDNVGANNRFSVLIDVVVLDVPTNVGLPGNQTMLANTASVTYQGNPSNPAPAGVVFTYVIEPKVEISKSVTPSIVDAGDIVTFMIVATNSGLATAFDIELRDTLDPNYFDISTVNNITLPGGFDVSVETNDIVIRSSPTAVFGDGKILAGELRWFAFEVAISSNVTPNARFTNTAQIVWDTIDKTNAVNEQRTYDPEEAFVPLDVPNLAITKSPQRTSETGPVDTTGSDVTIGEVVTYRIVVDLPETTIPDLMITDNLPPGMAYWSNVVVDTAGFGGTLPVAVPNVSGGVGDGAAVSFTFSGNTLVTGDNNPANNSFAIEFDAIVLNVPSNDGLPATIDGTPQTALTNIATVTYLNNPSNSVPTPPVVVDVVEPSLLIDKTMSQSSGGVVTVTLAVTNRGAATAFDVVVTDLVSTVWFDTTTIAPVSIPNGFTFSVAGAPADAKVTIASDTTSGQPTNSIEVGEVVSFAFEVTLIPGVTGVATNTAVVSEYTTTDGPNPNEREEPPTDDSTTLSFPSFTLTKTVTSPTGRPADIGETVVFTINVENTGPIGFSTVALSDTYDTTYLAFTSATPAETSAGAGAIAWANVGPLPVGASTNILVSFTAVASTTPGDTTNSVVAALTTTNNIPLPPQTSEVPVEVLSPSYTLLKQKIEPTGVATVGQAVVFTITVTNDGEVDLNPVQLDDTYDSAILSFVSASPAADVNLPGSLTWNNVGLIPVGGSSVVTTRFTALVSTWPSDTTNIVVSTASTTNGTPLDPLTSSVPVQVASPGITLIKLAGNAPEGGIHYTNAGAEVIFTYVVTNIGDTYLSDVTVTDDVLGVIGTIPTVLAPGDSATLYYTSAVPAAVTNIGTSIGTPSYTNGLPIPGLTNVVATNDAVVHLFASLGDFVWLDANYNGIQDGGSETGMPSVTVTLYDSTGTNALATTTTDAGGYYFFTNLVPATYVVGFDPPSGYAFTLQDQGGNDAVDNDVDDSTGLTAPVTLEQGENNLTLDAGVFQLAQLGDFVWNDLNADGIQDAGEPGLSNVVVRLYDTNNVVLGTTTTDVNGAYAFTDLYPGTYVVEFDLPVGATFSPQDQGGDDTADSDANTSTGRTAPITLVSAEDNPTIDAGVYFPASLGDFVWNDLNANGIQNPGETGLPNIVVSLYDVSSNVVGVTTTDVNGAYAFTNLVPGTYTVGFDRPLNGNFSPSFAGATTNDSNADVTSGLSDAVTLTSGEHNPTIDAGIYFPASLGDFVWNDFNANGIQNPGETGMPNVVVTLYDNVLNPLMVTTTDVNGAYAFTNLLPGSYFVGFERPGGYEFTLLNQGGDDAVDSDANGTTGLSPLTTLQSGEHNPTVDAGLFARASLGDYVWHDVNWDGIQSGSETGFPGVVVTLYDAASNVLGTTTTDATGFYEFTNLVPNTYFVGVTPPAGFEFTQPNQGGDDTADSDTDLLGFMAPVTLISGENNPTLDSGLFQRASLGDFVWNDLNADGIQDAGEPGFTNVTVNLLSNGVVIATTTTDVNGAYSFTNLYPGTYEVEFLPPAGTTFSPQDEGGDDTIDSDANSTGRTDPVTLISGENNPTLDAGLYIPARLGDYIWHDVNWDGIQGGSETGIPNVVVTLYDAASNVVGTTTTDATGFYEFTNLVPNTYFVGVTPPAGYNLTQQYQGGDSTLDSNADADGFMAPVTLQSGDNDPTLDAGLYIPTSLGDYVWRDDNYNGVQDGAEPGISNVVVTLYDSGNAIVGTTTTDGTGFYEFTNLTPGVYSVGFTPPPNFELTLQFQGGNTNLDSNADQGTGISDSVTLISGDHNPTIDAGMFERASLGDYIWHDYDGNGVQDGSETGMPGVVVHLLDASSNVVNTTTTDSAGYYNFTNLLPGTYAISIETPPGYSITPPFMGGATNDSNLNPLTGVSDFVTLVSGEYNPTIDGGLYIPATLGDTVWHDVDGNGLQDGGSETGMPNVVVHLYNTNDVVIMTTTTDVSGVYLFTNLLPGFYYVGFEPPTGYQFTHKDAGLDDEQDSDADQITGLTDVTQIFSGDEDLSWDAGLYLPASLGDYVWLDEDYDSVQSGSETGMPDIVVNLYDANDVIVGTTTTDVNGAYVFTNLPPGSYTVEFVKGTNFVFVTPLEGGDTSLDSDADQTTGRTDPVVLLSGEHNPTIDAGLAQYGALGDFVWWDINDDGLHAEDLSFYGINDVTIRLFRVTGGVTSLWDVAVTATDTNGQMGWYFFYELPFGDYRVVVDQGNIPNYLPRKTTPMFYNVTISPQYIRFDADFGFNLDPTPITLKSFEATREGDDVRLDWETVSEFENIGYHLYRSESADGPRTRLNGDLIPGQGTGMGAAYTFTDSDVSRTATWYYWLEDVSQTFDTKLHGPAIVRAEAAQPQDESVANFLVDASQPGLYRITYEALAAAGLNPASLETDRIKIALGGSEVAIATYASGSTLKAGDSLLFYVPEGDGALEAQLLTGDNARRMSWAYAAPADEGALWSASVRTDGQLPFTVSPEWQRYMLMGFGESGAIVLDVSNAQNPVMLFGYATLSVQGETGIYLSHDVEESADCIAIEAEAIRSVQDIERP